MSSEIRAELGRRDMDRKDLAEATGMSANYLNVRLRDEQPINLNDIDLIATAFGISALTLMQRAAAAATEEPAESGTTIGGEPRGPLRTSGGSYTGPQTEEDDEMLRQARTKRRAKER